MYVEALNYYIPVYEVSNCQKTAVRTGLHPNRWSHYEQANYKLGFTFYC